MTNAWTNKGKAHVLGITFRAVTPPTNYYVALVTNDSPPTVDTNTLNDLTEITAGNGYTSGGYSLDRNSTDFDVLTEDDGNDRGVIEIKDVAWTASGGSIPSADNGARWAVLTDDNGTVASREVYAYWDLTSDRTVTTGQALTLVNAGLAIS